MLRLLTRSFPAPLSSDLGSAMLAVDDCLQYRRVVVPHRVHIMLGAQRQGDQPADVVPVRGRGLFQQGVAGQFVDEAMEADVGGQPVGQDARSQRRSPLVAKAL